MKIEISKSSNQAGLGDDVRALVEVRVTPSQLIVLSGEIVFRRKPGIYPNGFVNRTIFGSFDREDRRIRLWRKDGREVGSRESWLVRHWRTSREELDKVSLAEAAR